MGKAIGIIVASFLIALLGMVLVVTLFGISTIIFPQVEAILWLMVVLFAVFFVVSIIALFLNQEEKPKG